MCAVDECNPPITVESWSIDRAILHRLRNDAPHLLCRFKVRIGKVSVARRGAVTTMTEQLADLITFRVDRVITFTGLRMRGAPGQERLLQARSEAQRPSLPLGRSEATKGAFCGLSPGGAMR